MQIGTRSDRIRALGSPQLPVYIDVVRVTAHRIQCIGLHGFLGLCWYQGIGHQSEMRRVEIQQDEVAGNGLTCMDGKKKGKAKGLSRSGEHYISLYGLFGALRMAKSTKRPREINTKPLSLRGASYSHAIDVAVRWRVMQSLICCCCLYFVYFDIFFWEN